MYLFGVFVELSLHGFHCCSRIAGQSGPGRTKVRVATRALSVQPRLIVLGDLKYWLFHAASFPRTLVSYQRRNQSASVSYLAQTQYRESAMINSPECDNRAAAADSR